MSMIGIGTISSATVHSVSAIPRVDIPKAAGVNLLPLAIRRRSFRVAILCVMILIISAADLELTLRFLTAGGMAEANPLARYIMGFNCQWLLAAWKLLLTGIACGVLLGLRTRFTAELGAWICFGVMVWLAIRWGFYAEYAGLAAEHALSAAPGKPTDWVSITSN